MTDRVGANLSKPSETGNDTGKLGKPVIESQDTYLPVSYTNLKSKDLRIPFSCRVTNMHLSQVNFRVIPYTRVTNHNSIEIKRAADVLENL